MNQYELADIFDRIAGLLEIKGEVVYKTAAYRKAADSLRNFSGDLKQFHKENHLTDIPGVGKAISEKIGELLDTGKLGFLERLEEEFPASLIELLEVPDVGPKKAAMFYKEAGITSLTELESAAKEGKLRHLPGVGEKAEARILAGIEAVNRRSTRLPLGTVLPLAERWAAWLRRLPEVATADAAGSVRRRRTTIGDLDLVAASNEPEKVMDAFVHHPEVKRISAHGDAKSSVELHNGLSAQLWIQPPERYGSLLLHVTGSKEHNVHLREIALQHGYSMSEKGFLAEDESERTFADEESLYAALGLPWFPPELRENRGEIEAAIAGRLPRLIEMGDLKAELHAHSEWSDGALSILAMAEAARERGLKVLAITDHSQSLGVANGLNANRLREQRKAIAAAQEKLGESIRLLQGAEVEIRADGNLDYPDDVLAELDIVIASLHVGLRQPRQEVTARLINAIRNPRVDLIGHPSGRMFPNREGADLDWDAVLAAAKDHGVALEINAHPDRLDLDDAYAFRAVEMGILLSINTDAHRPENYDLRDYGVAIARRSWATPENVINAWEPQKLLDWLQNR
ncbi:MAG TPA: DNA polymerase/3'-5' exonuclease PolX [Anaerolineaceae bacterium]|nr:DNA polymerase/3'-5' exonuclease PolX [Anaerolineaceae bacterium]